MPTMHQPSFECIKGFSPNSCQEWVFVLKIHYAMGNLIWLKKINFLSLVRKALPNIVLSATLSGCGSAGAPDFSQMSAKYANILEQYQINMIFQNILRSSENRPVSFLDMPTINGSGSITTTPYASAFFTGGIIPYNSSYLPINGGLTNITPGVSLSIGNSFNFTQSSLDNAVFWKGYLNELPIEMVKYFEHNHIPKEVLLSLVVDEIIFTKPDGESLTLINNPLRPDHPEFQKHLYKLISYGLGAYLVDTSQKIGPPLTVANLKSTFGENAFEAMKDSGIVLQKVGGSSEIKFQPIQVSKKYKLCINANKYENFVRQEYGDEIFCQETLAQDINKPNAQKKIQPKLNIRIRSTNNIFEYLGQVTKAQLAENSYMVTLPPTATTFSSKTNNSNEYAIFVVYKNQSSTRPFSSIESLDGNTYSIPSENNGYSPLTIKLLSQFMSLQKIPGSIPASPSVLLK
ncbi:hypothetical protein AOC21_06665 [Polynucleobacter sp. VK25]|uniref:hypothetical protein n=1 Tax=Polynucleobacter sp. VK25 TaxID=1758398 RepID=UPI001BFE2A19|nr:hypothetical protein [Polynucleobacter sp. VK25]QWD67723.1 hypothetical protein AOC21_06665 [Polynucleobacter sp. VK25]